MPNLGSYAAAVGTWFRTHREGYSWPQGQSRAASENVIAAINAKTQAAVASRNPALLNRSLIDIHRWKTNNRQGVTDRFAVILNAKPAAWLNGLLALAPFNNVAGLAVAMTYLKIEHCNLPVASTQASFLFNRGPVPIIDQFVARFCARDFAPGTSLAPTASVLTYLNPIPFRIESDGTGGRRLAVYNDIAYQRNLNTYVTAFVPELAAVARNLNTNGIRFLDINGNPVPFQTVDVEMALFAWCMGNRDCFLR